MRLLPFSVGSLAGVLGTALALTLVATPVGPTGPSAVAASAPAAVPGLSVSTEVSGLAQPWDVKALPDRSLLITERTSRRLLRYADGALRPVSGFPSAKLWSASETGLMSLEIDPAFASNRRFYTCHGGFSGSRRDVRVAAWRLSADGTSVRGIRNLVTGIPVSSGRHGGCRLLVANSGALMIGTGDAAQGTNPRNLRSLGGKVLRVSRSTGAALPGNPYRNAKDPRKRLVFSYGHRNVQGLDQRNSGMLFSAEHGPSRDDEVNRVVAGGDYGWHPVPGYDESVPMTDRSLPGAQRGAAWSSGAPTIATSGAAFVRGSRWGDLEGTLAVVALKGERVVFMRFDRSGRLTGTASPAELRGIARLRSITQVPGGDLLVTTAEGSGDRVLRISPRG